MKNHYALLIRKFEIPPEAKTYLLEEADKIFDSYMNELEDIIAKFYKVKNKIKLVETNLEKLSQKSGVNIYTLDFILLASTSYYMLGDYKRANISEEIFWETIRDLQYKLFECKKVKGVWGNFVAFWYNIFYNLDIFKLGRLEYERYTYNLDVDYVCDGVTVKKGDTVYSVHIPSCGPLTKELREESYKKAYEFFKDELCGKALVLFCESWLLFPKNKEIFPQNSNLLDFFDEWDIIHSEESEVFHDCWRIFDKDYQSGQMNPQTNLQKNIVNYIENGGKLGEGYGIKIVQFN